MIYGSLAVLGGLLALLLPETLGQKLPETLQDGEEFGKRRKKKSINGEENENETVA